MHRTTSAQRRISPKQVDPDALKRYVRSRAGYVRVKRAVDIAIILMSLPAIATLIAVVALLIAVTMGRPVFFIQNRVGRNGRVFRMVKFRTMHPPKVSPRVPVATARDDPRITPLGWFLRRSHIDELPQLWNILKGDMTVIGPRPEQPELVEEYRGLIAHYDLRHLVTPGLSGWAQVCYGYATDAHETREKLKYDLIYVRHFGPLLDLRIFMLTLQIYLDPRYVR